MTINAERFDLSKGQSLDRVKEFLRANSLDRTQILLAQAVQISDGNSAFLLVYEDVSPPRVTGTSPANGASGIPTGADITILFSEAVKDPTGKVTVTRNGAALTEGVDYTFDPSSWPAAGSTTLTIKSAIDTTYNASYVVVLNGIEDIAGNALEETYVFSFTTQTQAAGVVYKQGSVSPSSGDITNGYADISFGTNMPDTNYAAVATLVGTTTQPSVGLRVSNKTASGFRIHFDGEDFSDVESQIDVALSGVAGSIDAAHKTAINTDHAQASHADPDNQISTMVTVAPTGTTITDRDFQTGNTIAWIAMHGAGS